MIKRTFSWLSNRIWQVITGVATLLFILEFFKIQARLISIKHTFDSEEIILYLIYLVILISIGKLTDILVKTIKDQNLAIETLDFKHKLSLQLAEYEDWESLIAQLTRVPGSIAMVEESVLFLRNPVSGRLEQKARWNNSEDERNIPFEGIIRKFENDFGPESSFSHDLPRLVDVNSFTDQEEYFIVIYTLRRVSGVIWFKLVAGEKLSSSQRNIYENIGDELSAALKVGQLRKKNSDMLIAESALSERNAISSYLHDGLNQNMAFMRMKLDRLITKKATISSRVAQKDLTRLLEVANQSYEIVRDKIKTMYPESTPRLTNLLIEHAKSIARRANFVLDINVKGESIPFNLEDQKSVFYVFQEALTNIENHADACNVALSIEWDEDNLGVTISDDGVGFNPDAVDKSRHFGLSIMEERIAKINGSITLDSARESGATVSIKIPIRRMESRGLQ